MGLLSLRLLAADHHEECHAPLCSIEARNAKLRYEHGEVVIPVHKSSHSSEDADSEDEEESPTAKSKLPAWTNQSELMRQLETQGDPTLGDQVFGQQIHMMDEACALQDIFGHSVSARSRGERGESGVWDLDRLTEEEEQEYLKKHAS